MVTVAHYFFFLGTGIYTGCTGMGMCVGSGTGELLTVLAGNPWFGLQVHHIHLVEGSCVCVDPLLIPQHPTLSCSSYIFELQAQNQMAEQYPLDIASSEFLIQQFLVQHFALRQLPCCSLKSSLLTTMSFLVCNNFLRKEPLQNNTIYNSDIVKHYKDCN